MDFEPSQYFDWCVSTSLWPALGYQLKPALPPLCLDIQQAVFVFLAREWLRNVTWSLLLFLSASVPADDWPPVSEGRLPLFHPPRPPVAFHPSTSCHPRTAVPHFSSQLLTVCLFPLCLSYSYQQRPPFKSDKFNLLLILSCRTKA